MKRHSLNRKREEGKSAPRQTGWIAPVVLGLLLCAAGLGGCATTNEHSTESFLKAAGFQTKTPSTPKQKEVYAQMEPYKLQKEVFNGKTVYAYKDKKQGVVYFGTEPQYKEYQRLIAEGIGKAWQMSQSLQIGAWSLDQ